MRSGFKALIVTAASTATLVGGGLATSAEAAPIAVGNLVNVQVTNVLNNNQVAVQIPITAAANICGVAVDVLSSGLASGPVSCDSRSGNQTLTVSR